MQGRCHCGAVEVSVPHAPTAVTECHCSICRKYAGLWAYYPVKQVTLSGPTETYVWGRKYLTYHRCADCGCVMAWLPRSSDYPECGVNARMLDRFDPRAVDIIAEEDAST